MRTLLIAAFLVAVSIAGFSQAFRDEIETFKKEDKLNPPPSGAVLFVGSSSFRLWDDINADFPDHKIINRGFGGSTFQDVLRYANDIIIPYKASHVVIYCGDNDLANDVPSDSVVSRFKRLFKIIRHASPNTKITYVSIKPSPSRIQLIGTVRTTNNQIASFLRAQKKAGYVDVFSLMIDKNGTPREELFVEDRLHMNRTGYDIWKKAIARHL